MVPEFALRLRLAAAVLRCETRKDLASAFRRVNPNTSFDLDRADKWLSGKALPRTTDIYRDWAKLLALDRAAEWLTSCAIDDLLDALAARYDTTPDAILQRARGFPRGAPAPDAVGRGDSGSSFVESAYACYQYAFTPYYPGRLVRGSLVIGPGRGRKTAEYTEDMGSAPPAKFTGAVVLNGRGMSIELHQVTEGDTHLYLVLFAPSPPASLLAGVVCGTAILGAHFEPSMSRIVLIRVPGTSLPFDRSAPLALDAGASIAADLAGAGLHLRDGAEADRRLQEFLPARTEHGIEQVSAAAYQDLVALFDQEYFTRITMREPVQQRARIRSVR